MHWLLRSFLWISSTQLSVKSADFQLSPHSLLILEAAYLVEGRHSGVIEDGRLPRGDVGLPVDQLLEGVARQQRRRLGTLHKDTFSEMIEQLSTGMETRATREDDWRARAVSLINHRLMDTRREKAPQATVNEMKTQLGSGPPTLPKNRV